MEPNTFNLTLEQQFLMQRMKTEIQHMNREQAVDLLLQASRLLMLKNNLIKSLSQQTCPQH